jgi:hypothetical protein
MRVLSLSNIKFPSEHFQLLADFAGRAIIALERAALAPYGACKVNGLKETGRSGKVF